MEFLWFLIGSFGVLVITYLLIIRYMRRHHGVQPGYGGVAVAAISMICVLVAFYVLHRMGVDLRGQTRELLWPVLSVVWLVHAAVMAYQRQSSGTVVMDLGPNPMWKLQTGFGVLMAAMAIALIANGDSPAQAFAYAAWAVWLLVMACGRLQIRERGVIASAFVAWKRISGCTATAPDVVRLHLKNGIQRKIDLRLPADRIDEYVELVRRGAEERRLAT